MTTLTTSTTTVRDHSTSRPPAGRGRPRRRPVLGLTWLAQGLVRDGYDFTRHPMSLLALGEGGWVQIASFVATGGLMLACSAGLRRVLTGGRVPAGLPDWSPRSAPD